MTTYMDALNRQIDRLFDEALGECGTSSEHWVPACNVREDENGFYVCRSRSLAGSPTKSTWR